MAVLIARKPVVAADLTTITQIASATSTATTITGPAGIEAGDLLVLVDRAENISGVPTLVTPTGFTSINNLSDGAFNRVNLSFKIADGSEASASITGMAGTDYVTKAMYVFRGDVAIAAASPQSVAGEQTAGNPAAQNVAAASGTPPLVVIATYSAYADPVDPRTMSPAKDGEVSVSVDTQAVTWLAYKIYDASPADVSVDMDDEGTLNALQSCRIDLS
jgi:hypothetical protein